MYLCENFTKHNILKILRDRYYIKFLKYEICLKDSEENNLKAQFANCILLVL